MELKGQKLLHVVGICWTEKSVKFSVGIFLGETCTHVGKDDWDFYRQEWRSGFRLAAHQIPIWHNTLFDSQIVVIKLSIFVSVSCMFGNVPITRDMPSAEVIFIKR